MHTHSSSKSKNAYLSMYAHTQSRKVGARVHTCAVHIHTKQERHEKCK